MMQSFFFHRKHFKNITVCMRLNEYQISVVLQNSHNLGPPNSLAGNATCH